MVNNSDNTQDLEKKLDKVKTEIEELKTEINALRTEISQKDDSSKSSSAQGGSNN